jgi:hypothetical protein
MKFSGIISVLLLIKRLLLRSRLMNTLCRFVTFIVFIYGCGSTKIVNNKDFRYEDLNQKLKGQKVTLEFTDERKVKGRNVRVSADSTYFKGMFWGNRFIEEDVQVPTSSLKQIINEQHDVGALKGFGLGLLFSAAFGYATISNAGEGLEGAGAVVGTGFFSVSACIIGAVIGGIIGDHETFYLPQPVSEDTSSVILEFTKIIKKGSSSITILWQGREIQLLYSQYKQIMESKDGVMYIKVSKEINEEKFK